MASPRLGPCSERAWSPLQTNGGTESQRDLPTCPGCLAWPSPGDCCWLPAAILSKKSWGLGRRKGIAVGLLYLGLSDKVEMSPSPCKEPENSMCGSSVGFGDHPTQGQGKCGFHGIWLCTAPFSVSGLSSWAHTRALLPEPFALCWMPALCSGPMVDHSHITQGWPLGKVVTCH